MKTSKLDRIWPVAVLLFFALGSWLMLYPSSRLLFERGSGSVHGAHVDTLTLSFYYEWIWNLFKTSPLQLLNGALYSPQMGAPFGHTVWVSYLERLVVLLFGGGLEASQLTVAVPWVCLILNGVCATFVCQKFGLGRGLSLAAGVILAWSPFTYWRASMHFVLAGLYVFPLFWLGFLGFKNARSVRQVLLSGLWLLPALSASPYLTIICITMVPGLGLWVLSSRGLKHIPMIVLGMVPFGMTAVWFQLKSPIPGLVQKTEPPRYSQARAPGSTRAWDVLVYSARPLSYLAGNTDPTAVDPLPPRRLVTERFVERERPNFYPQEQANGLRWTVLVLFFAALLFWVKRFEPEDRRSWLWLFGVTAFAYWCSLSPRSFSPLGIGMGPSRWIHAVFPEVRAPNRWGGAVIWGLSLITFQALTWRLRTSRLSPRIQHGMVAAVLILVMIEFPPTFSMPLSPEVPRANLPMRDCGLGVFFPYNTSDSDQTYRVIASLRGTDCQVLNHQGFPNDDVVLKARLSEASQARYAKPILQCLGVQWIKRSPPGLSQGTVTESEFRSYCAALSGAMSDGERCELHVSAKAARPGSRAACLNSPPWSPRL